MAKIVTLSHKGLGIMTTCLKASLPNESHRFHFISQPTVSLTWSSPIRSSESNY